MAVSTTYIFGTLLTANGNLKQLNLMALTGICINIILNVILIRYNGALGSAYSGLITQSLTALIQLYLASKIFKFRVNHRLIVLLVLFVIGVLLANYFTHKLPFDWRINFVIMAGVSGLWALAIGLINIKSILRFVKY